MVTRLIDERLSQYNEYVRDKMRQEVNESFTIHLVPIENKVNSLELIEKRLIKIEENNIPQKDIIE